MMRFVTILAGMLLLAAPLFATPVAAVRELGDTTRIEQVVIVGRNRALPAGSQPLSVTVLGREQIDRRGEASLLPLLNEQIPGLFITSRGIMGYGVSTGAAGSLNMRGVGGSPTTGVLVLIDGAPQYMGLMGHPLADSYQTLFAERVEVVSGPASLMYGSNAMGGAVNIITREQHEEGLRPAFRLMYGSWNTLSADAALQLRKGRFRGSVAASCNRSDGHRPDMGFSQWSGGVKGGWDLGESWKVSGQANLSRSLSSNPGTVASPLLDNDADILRGNASLALEHAGRIGSGALRVYGSWGRHRINDGYSPGAEPLEYRFRSTDFMCGVAAHESFRPWRGGTVTAGADWQCFGGLAWQQYPDRREELADKTFHEVAGYLDVSQQWGIVTLSSGLRVDAHSRTGVQLVPRFGVVFELGSSTWLKANAARGFRNPTIREMYLFPPQNPDLKPEHLWNFELSCRQEFLGGKVSVTAALFRIHGADLIQTLSVEGRPRNVNIGKVDNWGAEGSVSGRIARCWRVNANYAWLHAKYRMLAAPEHKLYAGVEFLRNRWSLSSGAQYVRGLCTDLGSGARETYLLWNVRCACRLHRSVECFVHGENLLDRRYEINAGYPMPGANVTAGVRLSF